MILFSVLASIAAIGVICCLLFYLAVYALPLFAGVTAGVWAYGTGAGWLGGIAIGIVAGLATLLAGNLLLAFVRPLWLRLMIAAAFVAPAAIAGYHATHGIVKHTMPLGNLAGRLLAGRSPCRRHHRPRAAGDAGPARPDRTGRGACLRPFHRFGHDQITPPICFPHLLAIRGWMSAGSC